MRHPREKAQREAMGRIGFVGEFGVGHQVPRGGGSLQGREQSRSPFLAKHGIGSVAIPTVTHKGHPAVLRDHQCQDGLFQVGAVVFGMAMGERNGLLSAGGYVGAGQGRSSLCREG